MQRFPPEWPRRKAIEALTQRLGLRLEWCQDWELEVADPSRLDELCDLYEGVSLSVDEKFALMSLLVFSYDDYLQETPVAQRDPSLEARIERLLREDFVLHFHTIQYWCCLDEASWTNPADPDDPQNGFLVTP